MPRSRVGCASGGTARSSRPCGWRGRLESAAARHGSSSPAGICTSSVPRLRTRSPRGPASRRRQVRRPSTRSERLSSRSSRRLAMDRILASDEPVLRRRCRRGRTGAAPAERRHVLPPPASRRTGAAGRERGPSGPSVDVPGVARRAARRRRHRRHMAPRGDRGLDRDVASSLASRAPGGRSRGRLAAAGGPGRPATVVG